MKTPSSQPSHLQKDLPCNVILLIISCQYIIWEQVFHTDIHTVVVAVGKEV